MFYPDVFILYCIAQIDDDDDDDDDNDEYFS